MGESGERRTVFRQIERSDQLFARESFAERDLDSVFPEFADGSTITWGGVFAVASPGPSSPTTFRGVGWQLHIQLEPYEYEERGDNGEEVTRSIPPPVGVLSVITGETTLNRARDVGPSLLRSLVGFVAVRTKLLFGATLQWEGASRPAPDGKIVTVTAIARAHLSFNAARSAEIQGELQSFDPLALKAEHRLAFEWIAEAWGAPSPPLQLANLWFALVVVVDKEYHRTHSRSEIEDSSQMERVKNHLLLLPISDARRGDLFGRFESAYKKRNKVVHEGDRTAVRISDVEDLFSAISEFLLTEIGRTT